MLTQKLRLAATSFFLFVGLTTTLFGALPAQTVWAQEDEETTASETEEGSLATGSENTEEGDGCVKSWLRLDWIGCSVLAVIDQTLDWLNRTINSLLFVDPVPEGIEPTWAVFRNLAYIILIPMMLLMVIGTAINMGPFDPYTVKKALPRMFIAVIFIALSLPICSFFINISNVIGNGAGNLITTLSGTDALTGLDGAAGGSNTLVTGGALLALTGSITWGVIGSLGLVMIVGLLIGFFILILRQVLIVMLIILAPLAILVWIFPGNDKLWGVWRTTFTAMLFMYPLIAILIASGKFFAQTAQTTGIGGGGTVTTIIAMIGYVAPYFMIPATFKYGLGVFGNLAGMVNDRSRGFFDNQRKKRDTSRQIAKAGNRAGDRFNNRAMNALTSRATTRNLGFGTRGQQAYQQKMAVAGAAFGKTEQGQALQHNDPALQAMTYGSEAQARAMLGRSSAEGGFGMTDRAQVDRAVAAVKASGGFGRSRQEWAAQQLGVTGTGYSDMDQVTSTIARVAGGNESRVDALAGNLNATTKAVGTPGLSPGFGTMSSLAKAKMQGATSITRTNEDGSTSVISMKQAHADASFEATGSVDAMTTMRSKGPDFENNTVPGLLHGLSSGDERTVASAEARVHDLINTLSYGPQPNQNTLLETFGADSRFEEHIQRALDQQRQGRMPDQAADNAAGITNPPAPPPAT